MSQLRVAILHHHLRGGGVTRIIEHTIDVLKENNVSVCVVVGEKPPSDISIPEEYIVVVEGLSYGENNPPRKPEELLKEVQAKAEDNLQGKADVWHVHNHSLGKNAAVSEMVLLLAEQQEKMLFHIHDFAEDNRPDNYQYMMESDASGSDKSLVERLYPIADHIYYGVLNGRDYKFLKDLNFPEERLKVLSNPVSLDLEVNEKNSDIQQKIPGNRLILYPSRVIPRKNIGEFLLWSALANSGDHFAVTLPPKNPKYKNAYQDWKDFAEEMKLPVTFEAGFTWDISFAELIKQADAFINTSVAEGFGLVFLESWLAEKPLLGRLLPDITADFQEKGIQFPGMYHHLLIPVEWLDKDKLMDTIRKAVLENWKRYGRNPSKSKMESWINKLIEEERIDFGKLNDEMQKKVIVKLIQNPELKDKMSPSKLYDKLPSEKIIQHNQSIIQEEYNLEKYGNHLIELYKKISASSQGEISYADSSDLLNKFLSPENFSLLKN